MEIVVSGMRSTGCLHLGNYFGAATHFLKMQEDKNYHCNFFIADLHSLTTHPTPDDFKRNTNEVLVDYLACGLDPEKSVLYAQSDIPEIPQLYLLLNMLAYKGELERVASFKDKVRKQEENVNAGLLTYPVLMAADILIHKAHKVPVGKDQVQHLEMTRNFGNRFNHLYKTDFFPEPYPFTFSGTPITVPGLDGTGKMGKSDGNGIYLRDEPEVVRKKVMKAVTDGGPTTPNSEMPDAVKNIFTLLKLVSTVDTVNHFETKYNDCSIRYGDLKKQLAEDIILFTAPIRSRINDIINDKPYQEKVLKMGAEKARESASATLNEVRKIMGM
ncbi:MAG: tryptophan--tRNA ligase [Bacteroidota bacterium]|jgi:tryptophanyl-tRNA synthetase